MPVASFHPLRPISPRLNPMVGGKSGRLHLPPISKKASGSNDTLERDLSPPQHHDEGGRPGEEDAVSEFGLNSKMLGPVTKPFADRAKAAAIVLNRYRIKYENDWDFPQSILRSQDQVKKALELNVPIELVIPAFPFKSSNRSRKVLGPLPDEAERLSLLHLNGLCLAIKDATDSDTYLTIVSDGITYNDLLGVSDEEVWRYGQQLRCMAEQNDCHCIRFSRICDLVGAEHESERLDETLYLAKVSEYRCKLEANTPSGFDVSDAIATDPDISTTYKGYKKFLMGERDDRTIRSRSQTERENSVIAKAMILRGKAFAEAVRIKYPDSIRLSIHPSNDTNKVSITMLPQNNEIIMTPWHGAVVRGIDGSVSLSHAILVPAMTHDIVYVNGRPSYFRERSDIFNWPEMDVTFEYLYPCGIIIKPVNPASTYPLSLVDLEKIRNLAITCSPIILRGFSSTKQYGACMTRSSDLTPSLSLRFRVMQELQEESMRVLQTHAMSAETISVYCEGAIGMVMVQNENTLNKNATSGTPRLQHSAPQPAAHLSDDCTLFASSSLFARYLPQAYNINKLEKIKWTWKSHRLPHRSIEHIPLVIRHPIRNSPCICWHQPWPTWQMTRYLADFSIENGTQSLIPLISNLLVDRRVCLRVAMLEGDVLVCDNLAMLHTFRTSLSIDKSVKDMTRGFS
ncbi:Clavaminate synthase-like protein [Xylaria sp. FL1042]|nr:Clavaminate synthase-like protein [Xylaria sp. FL1042]